MSSPLPDKEKPHAEEEINEIELPSKKLKFVERLSSEHILIGNENQLDLISIAAITISNFVDTEFLFSLRFEQDIHLVAVDNKSKYLRM